MNNNIDSELFESMFQLSKNLKEKMTNFSERENITLLQYMALSFIDRKQTVHMKEISDYFSIEMPTATSLLNKLAKLSLVNRTEDATDRRVVKISLSKKGSSLLEEAKKIQKKNMTKMLSVLSDKQKKEMKNILTTILEKT